MGILPKRFLDAPARTLRKKMFTTTTTTTTTATSMVSSIASSTHSKARSKIVVCAEPTKPKLKKAEEFTVGGGGARGYCDSEEIKDAMKECEGTRVLRLFLDTNSRNPRHHFLSNLRFAKRKGK